MSFYFEKHFLYCLQQDPKKWKHVPPGRNDNKEMEDVLTYVTSKFVQEGNERTCLFKSLASAIYYVFEHKKGQKELKAVASCIARPKKSIKSADFKAQLDWIKKILFSNPDLFETRERVLVSHKKSAAVTFYNPLEMSKTYDRTLTILVPVGTDKCNLHAVCLVDNLVFDSSLKHPMKLLKKSLDWCCNCQGGMIDMKHAVHFKLVCPVLQEKNVPKCKVSRIRNEKNST